MPVNPLLGEEEDKKDEAKITAQGEAVDVPLADTGQQAQVGGPAPTASGSFTNLNKYIEANKDQGAGLGSKVEQNVEKSANQGLSSLSSAQQEFGKAQEQAGVTPNINKEYVQSTIEKAQKSPAQVGEEDIKNFTTTAQKAQALEKGTDTAPKSLSEVKSYQTAKGQLEGATEKAGLTKTESGREQLLKESFARPDYTKGQSSLDQLLTQNVDANRQRFNDLQNRLLGQYGLATQDAKAVQAAAQKREQVKQQTGDVAKAIQSQLTSKDTGVLPKYENELLARPGQLNAEQAKKLADKQAALKQYLQGATLFGANPDELIRNALASASPVGAANYGNAISPEQAARLSVLNRLAGREAGTLGNMAIPQVSADQFQTGVNYDPNKIVSAINDKRNALKNDTQSQIGLVNSVASNPAAIWNKDSAPINVANKNYPVNESYKNSYDSVVKSVNDLADIASRYGIKLDKSIPDPAKTAQQTAAYYHNQYLPELQSKVKSFDSQLKSLSDKYQTKYPPYYGFLNPAYAKDPQVVKLTNDRNAVKAEYDKYNYAGANNVPNDNLMKLAQAKVNEAFKQSSKELGGKLSEIRNQFFKQLNNTNAFNSIPGLQTGLNK